MNATTSPGALKKFRRTPWRFQQTVELPDLGDRDRFVSTIIGALQRFESTAVIIDEVVFNTVRSAGFSRCASVSQYEDLTDWLKPVLRAWKAASFGCARRADRFSCLSGIKPIL